jgi:hypothetical protein
MTLRDLLSAIDAHRFDADLQELEVVLQSPRGLPMERLSIDRVWVEPAHQVIVVQAA